MLNQGYWILKETATHKDKSLSVQEEMSRFFSAVERRAFLTARLATHNEDDALDIVQDAMLKLIKNYARRPPDEWKLLFHSILHNCINDWYRRSSVRSRWQVSASLGQDDMPADPEGWVAQTQFPEPEQQMAIDHLSERLAALVSKLPLRQQQAVLLRAWEGYNTRQTAAIMQCTEGSVKTHYSRALSHLRRHLGDYQ